MSEHGGEHTMAQALSETIGRLAHDVKNPLAVVLSNLRYLESQIEDSDLKEAATESAISAERIVRMLDDVAQLHSLASGAHTANRSTQPLAHMISHLEEAIRPQMGSRRFELELSDDPVHTDFGLLFRITVNILEHAIRRTPSSGLIRLEGSSSEGAFTLRVFDEGPPFDPDTVPSFLATQLPEARNAARGFRSDQGSSLFFAGVAARFLGARCKVGLRDPDVGVIFEMRFGDPPPP